MVSQLHSTSLEWRPTNAESHTWPITKIWEQVGTPHRLYQDSDKTRPEFPWGNAGRTFPIWNAPEGTPKAAGSSNWQKIKRRKNQSRSRAKLDRNSSALRQLPEKGRTLTHGVWKKGHLKEVVKRIATYHYLLPGKGRRETPPPHYYSTGGWKCREWVREGTKGNGAIIF